MKNNWINKKYAKKIKKICKIFFLKNKYIRLIKKKYFKNIEKKAVKKLVWSKKKKKKLCNSDLYYWDK